MIRTVKRWAPMNQLGHVPGGAEVCKTKKGAASCLFHGETIVRVTVTYDDGRPAPKRRKAKKGGKRG